MKYLCFIFFIMISFNANAVVEHELECVPEEKGGFSASISIRQVNTTWIGKINSFETHHEWSMPTGCAIPNLGGLNIGGHLDQKFYYHESEYEEGCILRVVFLSTVGVSAWVYPKGNLYNQSNKLNAKCSST